VRGKEGGEGVRWGGVFLCRCRAISSIIARAIVAFTRFGCGAVMLYAIYSDSTTSDYTCKANDKRNDFFCHVFCLSCSSYSRAATSLVLYYSFRAELVKWPAAGL
jgi:hypothetical protein